MRRISDFILWIIILILTLGLGIYVGHKVTAAYKDIEIMDVQASLAEVNVELAFWKTTIKGLAEGKQFEGAELNGRPSIQD
jgi:hypothetical protein